MRDERPSPGDWFPGHGSLLVGGLASLLLILVGSSTLAQDHSSSDQIVQTTRHFRVERPADLTAQDTMTIYARILDTMTAAYGLSGDASSKIYLGWRRYNRVPYRSATHGERFVNNYANALAKAYGSFESAGPMPEGALLAKDSFAVTARGDVFSGPLFLMEKMAPGFSPANNDWRYSMIMPDGSLFGETGGPGAALVAFCHTCHSEVGETDNLFFVPEDKRVRFLEQSAAEYPRWGSTSREVAPQTLPVLARPCYAFPVGDLGLVRQEGTARGASKLSAPPAGSRSDPGNPPTSWKESLNSQPPGCSVGTEPVIRAVAFFLSSGTGSTLPPREGAIFSPLRDQALFEVLQAPARSFGRALTSWASCQFTRQMERSK